MCPILEVDGVPFEFSEDASGVYLEHAFASWGGHGPTLETAIGVIRRICHEMLECHEMLSVHDDYTKGIRALATTYRAEFDNCSCENCCDATPT